MKPDGAGALEAVLRQATAEIEGCEDAAPHEGKQAVRMAMLQLIEARNALIRQGADEPRLVALNAVLSLMASIEFPLAGFHRERLKAVGRALESLRGVAARAPS